MRRACSRSRTIGGGDQNFRQARRSRIGCFEVPAMMQWNPPYRPRHSHARKASMLSIAGFRSFALGAALVFCASAALAEQVKINGVTRTFTVQFPEAKPAPLVIALHGNTQTGADMMTRTSWPDVA